jgi:hypothetical protein
VGLDASMWRHVMEEDGTKAGATEQSGKGLGGESSTCNRYTSSHIGSPLSLVVFPLPISVALKFMALGLFGGILWVPRDHAGLSRDVRCVPRHGHYFRSRRKGLAELADPVLAASRPDFFGVHVGLLRISLHVSSCNWTTSRGLITMD